MPAWEAFQIQFGQLLPLQAQTPLFLESENKGCSRFKLIVDDRFAAARCGGSSFVFLF
jgi:hypothetical protein